MLKTVSWTAIKTYILLHGLKLQWVDADNYYYLAVTRSEIELNCTLDKLLGNQAEIADFETNFKN